MSLRFHSVLLLTAGALCATLLGCAGSRGGSAARTPGSAPRIRVIRPSIKRLRFYNETSHDTTPLSGGSHVVAWHSLNGDEPEEADAYKVGSIDSTVGAGDPAELGPGPKDGPNSLAVKWTFKLAGHATAITDWIAIPVPVPANKILEVDVTVLDGPNSVLVISQVHYYDDAVGRSQYGPTQVHSFPMAPGR